MWKSHVEENEKEVSTSRVGNFLMDLDAVLIRKLKL